MGNFGSCKTKGVHVALLQHSIPTLDVLNHRSIADTPYCPLSGMCNSWKHALVECSMVSKDDMVEHMIMTRITNAKLWLATIHDSLQ